MREDMREDMREELARILDNFTVSLMQWAAGRVEGQKGAKEYGSQLPGDQPAAQTASRLPGDGSLSETSVGDLNDQGVPTFHEQRDATRRFIARAHGEQAALEFDAWYEEQVLTPKIRPFWVELEGLQEDLWGLSALTKGVSEAAKVLKEKAKGTFENLTKRHLSGAGQPRKSVEDRLPELTQTHMAKLRHNTLARTPRRLKRPVFHDYITSPEAVSALIEKIDAGISGMENEEPVPVLDERVGLLMQIFNNFQSGFLNYSQMCGKVRLTIERPPSLPGEEECRAMSPRTLAMAVLANV